MKTCEQCQHEFQPVRATARFCSAKCRVANGRKAVTDEPGQAAGPVTLTPKAVTAAADGARKLQKAVDAVASRMHPCCKHCPGHPHARHLDPCRQGCA